LWSILNAIPIENITYRIYDTTSTINYTTTIISQYTSPALICCKKYEIYIESKNQNNDTWTSAIHNLYTLPPTITLVNTVTRTVSEIIYSLSISPDTTENVIFTITDNTYSELFYEGNLKTFEIQNLYAGR
jgi:hypothetical protein